MENDTESFSIRFSPPSDEPPPEYDDELDEEFAPRPKARLGAATIALAALLVAGVGFVVGVYVQKNHGPASTSGASNTAAAAFASRARTGGFGGGTAGGTGFGGGTGGTTGTGGTGGSTGTSSTPVVIGTVVSVNGTTMIVKNFAGKDITVTLSTDTTVSKAATAADLAAGQTVTVDGSTGTDGSVTASSVSAK
jgi:Domain of unknown function (DUF5666)